MRPVSSGRCDAQASQPVAWQTSAASAREGERSYECVRNHFFTISGRWEQLGGGSDVETVETRCHGLTVGWLRVGWGVGDGCGLRRVRGEVLKEL